MTRVLGIDPGNTASGWALINADTRFPEYFGKEDNEAMRGLLLETSGADVVVAVEMIASYGMPVGKTVFDTCLWVGRFIELAHPTPVQLITRNQVKNHLCHSSKAKDGNVAQALADRFAPGLPNRGKGTKADPGWFHGFAADIWQAYAVAVYVADHLDAEAL